jgi:hypothetical protein
VIFPEDDHDRGTPLSTNSDISRTAMVAGGPFAPGHLGEPMLSRISLNWSMKRWLR